MPGDDLLGRVIDAHGGLERFERLEAVRWRLRSGGALRAKRGMQPVPDFTATLSLREPRTVLDPYPAPGLRGVFDHGLVRIEDGATGDVIKDRPVARSAFGGLFNRRHAWWDELDFLYFAGYALWQYAVTPFVFTWPGVASREIEPWHEDGQTWRRLEVTFPRDWDVHCQVQRLAFDDRGRLRRQDYTAEIIGPWANAVHYASEHATIGDVVWPLRRRVHPRGPGGRPVRAVTLVGLDLDAVEVVER
jgi:hypothetical protein